MTEKELLAAAERARENAYAPYSHFQVGAALLTSDGRVFLGANVENASFGATSCAERSAVFAAVSAGVRDFEAIAICGGHEGERGGICPPCGICRQVLSEFCKKDFRILLGNADEYREYALSKLLPHSFGDEVRA